ncbi:MAG: PKD-like domain-containing protein, partial [Bacteroidales bacterium]
MQKIYQSLVLFFLFIIFSISLQAQTITISPITPTIYCTGSIISIPFTITGSFANGNVFTAQLSDNTGSFNIPFLIGTLTDTSSGTIIGTIPQVSIQGNGYLIRIKSSNPQDSSSNTIAITINSIPSITSAFTDSICSGVALNYQILSSVAGTTFNWSRAIVSGISNAAAIGQITNPITEALTNTTTFPINVVYHIIPTSNGCVGSQFTYTVKVKPKPTITSIATTNVCSGVALNYIILNSLSGTTNTWSRAAVTGISNLAVSGLTNNPINEVLTKTTLLPVDAIYLITPSKDGCLGDLFTFTVTVNTIPNVNAGLDKIICYGQNTTIGSSQIAGNSYFWVSNPLGFSSLNSEPIVTPNSTKSFILTQTIQSTGCFDKDTVIVYVNSLPIPKIKSNNSQFTNTPASNPTLFRRCGSSAPHILTLENNGGTNSGQFLIKWGDGISNNYTSFSPLPSHSYPSLGAYDLTFIITDYNGCIDSAKYKVFIGTNPAGLTFTNITSTTTECAPKTYAFKAEHSPTDMAGNKYTVSTNDLSLDSIIYYMPDPPDFTPDTIYHTFSTSSCGFSSSNYQNSFFIKIKNENYCGSTITSIEPIQLNSKPTASFNMDSIGCVNQQINANSTSQHGSFIDSFSSLCDSSLKFYWQIIPSSGWIVNSGSLGDSLNYNGTNNISLSYTTPGTFTVILRTANIDINSCSRDSYSKTICIKPIPAASFTMNKTTSFCAPDTVRFTNTSNAISQCGPVAYSWQVTCATGGCIPACGGYTFVGGTSNISIHPKILFSQYGNYTVTLNVNNGCGTSNSQQLIVVKKKPELTIANIPTICANQSINPFVNFNSCSGGITSWNWLFPGGSPTSSNQQNPGYITYTTAGNYTVTVSASNECGVSNPSSTNFNVIPLPTATISGNITVCQNVASPLVIFTNPQNIPVTITYNINGGSNITLNVGANTTASINAPTGVADSFVYNLVSVVYQNTPLCSNNITGTVTVIVNATPTANAGATQSICQGGSALLAGNIGGSATGGIWTSNSGGSFFPNATALTASWIPPAGFIGIASLTLTTTGMNPCPSVTSIVAITVLPTPTATIFGTNTVCQNSASPNITFNNPQNYPVTITYNINGGSNSIINVSAGANATVPAPTTTSGTFIYNMVSVAYQSLPLCTNNITGTVTIIVRPTPMATIFGSTTVCQNGAAPTIIFTNPQNTAVTITYNINGGTNQTINVAANSTSNLIASTAIFGTYSYNLVNVFYQNAPTCQNTVAGTITIIVKPTPTASISGNATVCQNGTAPTIIFTNPQNTAVTITYNINGGTNQTINVAANSTSNLIASTAIFGTYSYNLVNVFYQNAPTCQNTVAGTITIIVKPTPTASISGNATVCQNGTAPTIIFSNPQNAAVTITYNINGGSNQTINIAANSTSNITASTSIPGNYSYNLVNVFYQTSPTCQNTITGNVTIMVLPTPIASISGNTTVCQNGTAPTIIFTNPQNIAVTITYNINGGANQTINVSANSNSNVTVPTSIPGTYSYNLLNVFYQNNPACQNTIAGNATIIVLPTPLVTITGNTTVCQNGTAPTITFTNLQNSPVTITYNVNGGTNQILNLSANSISLLTASTNIPGTYNYNLLNVYYQNSPACLNNLSESITIIVYPKPKADFNLSDYDSCSVLTVTSTNTSLAYNGELLSSMSFSWNASNGLTSVATNPGFSFVNNGVSDSIYSLRLISTSSHGCKDTLSKTITVFPNPKSNFNPTTTVNCAPFIITNAIINLTQYTIANDSSYWYVNGVFYHSGTNFPTYTMLQDGDSVNITLVTSNSHGCKQDTLTKKFKTII